MASVPIKGKVLYIFGAESCFMLFLVWFRISKVIFDFALTVFCLRVAEDKRTEHVVYYMCFPSHSQ